MKSSEFRGFSQVFRFTLVQALKQKSYIITLIIMVLFSIAVFPVMKLVGNSKEDDTSIEKVYYINETNLKELSLDKIADEYEYLKDIEFVETTDTVETVCQKLDEAAANDGAEDNSADKSAVLVDAYVDLETGGYIFKVYFSTNSKINEDDANTFSDSLKDWFTEYKISVMDVDEELLKDITTPVSSEVIEYDEFVSMDEVKIITPSQYNMIYIMLMVFYMVIIMCASLVANKVVEEKANRIVEYLMTNVRPMALMLGKITAMLVAGVGEVLLILISGFASYKISEYIWPSEGPTMIGNLLDFGAIKGLGPVNVAICILIMVVGIFMYGLIAGLFGASVSKMEEVQQGLQIFTMIILVAFFASMIAANLMWSVGINGFVRFVMIFPLTSVMLLPGVIIIGEAGLIEVIISLVLMVATALFILWFISLIYESVIVMNGSIVSVKTMFGMAKDSLKKDKEVLVNEEK